MMSRTFEWERRLDRYGNQGRQVTNPYEAARVAHQSQQPGLLTTGQKVFREISYLAVGGLALKGVQSIHYGIKGARHVAITLRSGKTLDRYRDIRSGRLISRTAYSARPGLYSKLRTPDRLVRITGKKIEQKVVQTRTYRVYSKIKGAERLLKGPSHYLIHRYTPRPVKVGLFLYGGYRWLDRQLSDPNEPETIPVPGTGPRAEVNFILNQRLPPTSRGISSKKSGSRTSIPDSKSKKRCPPGHRWSSRLQKCVRVNGRRA